MGYQCDLTNHIKTIIRRSFLPLPFSLQSYTPFILFPLEPFHPFYFFNPFYSLPLPTLSILDFQETYRIKKEISRIKEEIKLRERKIYSLQKNLTNLVVF